jgi:phosphoenolpyruvate carboxylase
MDGNPNVTAETLEASLARHRQLALRLYRREVLALARRLSQSLSRVGVDGEVLERIETYRGTFPETYGEILPRHRAMPYRVLLRLMAARLAATARDRPGGYPSAEEYRRDLALAARSLETHRGVHAGLFALRRAERRAQTFGFHLVALDVRQDALVHRRVVGRLLGEEGWLDRDAAERSERLRRALEERLRPREAGEAEDQRTLAVFAAVARCRRRYGERAVGPYIVSMTRGPDDVLSVLLLARWGGLAGEEGNGTEEVPLDVVPLFETVGDLEAAPAVMGELFADPLYRRHLESRGDRQMVMIGYSDSSKDGGLAASRWALQKGQAALVETFAEAGVELTLFHGRGGTVSRGGGKVHRAVMAAPPGAVAGRLRMTEQGEVIDDKYGLRGIALRTLERTWGAVALATAVPRPAEPREARWREVMDVVADASRRAYRERVWEDPELAVFFRGATPIDVIERMRIGSRPASRRSGGGIESLRAIPWVFAWTQSRLILPGWYGLGSGLTAALERHGEETLGEMAAGWPFFANLLDDAEMVLAKADLAVAERYAALAGEVGRRLFPEIRAEFERTVEAVLRLKGTTALLDQDPTLERSIRLRNPYVDPMSLLQVDLLRRWREGERRDEALLRALVATVHGIAQGLQNTG